MQNAEINVSENGLVLYITSCKLLIIKFLGDCQKMAKFKCKVCGYVTDEFEELPEDYKCPMCGASADMFEKIEQVLQMAFLCKVCGFVLEEDELPEDYVCPVCGVPAANFEEQ